MFGELCDLDTLERDSQSGEDDKFASSLSFTGKNISSLHKRKKPLFIYVTLFIMTFVQSVTVRTFQRSQEDSKKLAVMAATQMSTSCPMFIIVDR